MRHFIGGDVLLFASLCMPLAAQVSPVAFSEAKDTVPAFDSSGAITLPAARLRLDLSYPHGKKERRDLSVVYDPQNGHYLWRLSEGTAPGNTGRFLEELKPHRFYADANGLFDFVSSGSFLWVKASALRAGSLDAAESAALNEIQQGLASIERYVPPAIGPPQWPWDDKFVDGRGQVPLQFSCFPMRADCKSGMNTIVSISTQGSNWRLVLRNRWDEGVILDSNFKLVSAQQLTQPKK